MATDATEVIRAATGAKWEEWLSEDDEASLLAELLQQPFHMFSPRPDHPEEWDEQSAFVNDSESNFCVLLGGNGSGKSIAAAYKTVQYILEHVPPRINTPFWVIGASYEMVCNICWMQKLSPFIQKEWIKDTDWYREKRNWPHAVILHDLHGEGTNWSIEFKSYEQGRDKFQGESIGGYWFNEEVPLSIVEEVRMRCREYNSPGWADFTPVEIRSPEWIDRYDEPPEGWRFFHLNSLMNTAIAPGGTKPISEFMAQELAAIPEDMRDTRRIGVFTVFKGQVFKEFRKSIHVVEPFEIPATWKRLRGMDFGDANPACCLWGAKDYDGRYFIYREHYAAGQRIAWHAEQINNAEAWLDYAPHVFGTTYSDHDATWRRELQANGIQTSLANKSSKLAGIETVRKLMMSQIDGRPKLYIFNTCKNLIREVGRYRWKAGTEKGINPRDPVNEPVDKDDHAIDALIYMTHTDLTSSDTIAAPPKIGQREWQRNAGRFLVQ